MPKKPFSHPDPVEDHAPFQREKLSNGNYMYKHPSFSVDYTLMALLGVTIHAKTRLSVVTSGL
jgi:hypothetical protein